jgi:flagellar biosynthesis/type III secretory pathway protein FliH
MAQGKREGMALGKREGMAQGKREGYGAGQARRHGIGYNSKCSEVLDMLDEDTRKEVERKLRYNPNPSPEDG